MSKFPIVGIGSSAGGLEALQTLFRAMPEDSGLGFVIAAHLDPTAESQLPELLGKCTTMPVRQIEDSPRVEPNHVYVIPPDRELTIRDGVLHAEPPKAPRGHRHPVDVFFRALAEDQGERAIAIVLSGTGANGSLGLRFIKAEGGIVLAQEPETAGFQGMPRSAIGTGVVDLVLAPDKMPEALLDLARHPYTRKEAAAVEASTPEDQLKALLALLRSRTKRDFNGYKTRTLLRRIHRRMSLHRVGDLKGYIERLRSDPEEVRQLAADLTINVTGFFRDPEAWERLREKVIQPLVRERPTESTIRVWVAACSTGEEAYSIAMLLTEEAEAAGKRFDLRLFATDVAESVLTPARVGAYPGSIAMDVGEERLARFFDHEDDVYSIKKSLREAITFAPQNLLQDPPFSRLDLISCRNLLIYLEPDYQKRLLGLFHFALRENGHLFLGTAETISGQEELFQPVSKTWRIFRRLGPTRHDVADFPIIRDGQVAPEIGAEAAAARTETHIRSGDVMLQALAERYAPASALIDSHLRVLYLRGPTGDYLQPASGEPSHHLLAMARDGLQMPLRKMVRQALDENREVAMMTRVRRRRELHSVRLVVTPLSRGAEPAERLLVGFFEGDDVKGEAPSDAPAVEADDGQLQAELDNAREDLRLTVEQMEASNEELKASNEEIRSINEELQASNEELETSKEELQSLNEELNTVNNQLQAKVGELEERTSDLNNLLNSTDIATLFLDRNLCIRWFTPAMKALFELRPTDVGRPIAHFAQRFEGGNLQEDGRKVLDKLTPLDAEVVSDEGRWYLRHLSPYRTDDDRIAGIVVSFTDITDRKTSELEVDRAREFAESIVDTVREPLLVLTPDCRVVSANQSFYQRFDVTPEETEGRRIFELGNRQWDIPALHRQLEEILPTDKQFEEFEVEHEFEKIGRRTMILNGRRLDHVQLILLAIQDVTERRQAERAIRESEERFRALVNATTFVVYRMSPDWSEMRELDGKGFIADTKGPRVGWMADYILEDDQPMVSAAIREAIDNKGVFELEHRVRREDGSVGWTLSRAVPLLDEGGEIVEWFGAASDVTARRQVESALQESKERLQRVLETEAVGVMFFEEASGVLIDANDVFLRMTGYSRKEVQDRTLDWRTMTPDEWIATSEEQMATFAETGRIGPYEKEYRLKDGSKSWMLFAGSSLGDGTVVEYCIDISERKRAEMERELLAHELSHRVKNTLAVVQALARQTDGRATSIEAYREAFLGRLQSMAKAHSVLIESNWQRAELKQLVEQAVAAYSVAHPELVEIEGARVILTPKQSLGLSLILHELGTNAAKYGALSHHDGRLRIAWQVDGKQDTDMIQLTWTERGGPEVVTPEEKGFGTRLIEQASSYELDGEAELSYAPEGFSCAITFPLEDMA